MNNNATLDKTPQDVFRPERDIVASNLTELRGAIRQRVAGGVRQLTIDLSNVHMVDSAGIGLLIAAHNSLQRTGGALELTHVGGEILELFKTMRLHQHLRIGQSAHR